MKAINFFLKIISAVAFILLINPADSIAQKQNDVVQKKKEKKSTSMTSDDGVAICDDLVAATYSKLEMQANKTCSSARTTVKCQDKKTGRPIYITVIAKPATEGCATTVKIKNKVGVTDRPKSRGGSDAIAGDARSFDVEVLQRQCPTGGVQLSAYIPGDDDASERYAFDWKANDKTIDSDGNLECTADRAITLTVTDKESKQVVTKEITLDKNADAKKN